MSAVRPDDPIGGGETETGPAADALGGEEGFEDPLEGFPVHPEAGVPDRQHGVVALLDLVLGVGEIGVADEPTAEIDISTQGHGVGCVDQAG